MMLPGLGSFLFSEPLADPLPVLQSLVVVDQTQNRASATSVNLTIPTVQDGDLLILYTQATDGASQACTFTAIPGWTTIRSHSSTINQPIYASLHYRIATASLSGTSVGTLGCRGGNASFSRTYKALLVVRGNTVIASVSVGGSAAQVTTGNPTAQTNTISGGTAPVFVIGTYLTVGSGQTVATRTFTVGGVSAKDGEYQETGIADQDSWIAWKSFDVGDSLATAAVIDMGTAGNSELMSCWLNCA